MGIALTTGARFSSHGRQPTAATHIPPHIATTTTTWWGHRIRGVTITIAAPSAIITATLLTIAKQLWVIASVAAKCSLIVRRSSSLENSTPLRRLRQLQLLPLLVLQRLLRLRLFPHLLPLHRVVVKALAYGIRIVRQILGALTRSTIRGALPKRIAQALSAPKHPTLLHHQNQNQNPSLNQSHSTQLRLASLNWD